jgi:uncharacterized membrane protein YoaK (UPF0700 family)
LVSDSKHGPLPVFLLILTVVTGLVDAVSILSLGRVFVANMTGNVVFIGFALAGAPGFSLSASIFALAGFLAGAFVGGILIKRRRADRAVILLSALTVELALIAVAVIVAQAAAVPYASGPKDALAALTAIAMGVQNATARRLAVPDLTTTVLTMTLTGLAADVQRRNNAALLRRLLAIVTMLGGAIVGAVLVLHVRPSAPLEVAGGLVAVVTVMTWRETHRAGEWRSA